METGFVFFWKAFLPWNALITDLENVMHVRAWKEDSN